MSKAVAHLVVDIQDIYCNPAHPYAVDSGNDVSRHEQLSIKMNAFISSSREVILPTWVIHGIKYIGKSKRYGLMFGEEGRDAPRDFALNHLYNQEVKESEDVLWKANRDAFNGTDLSARLHAKGTKAVIVSGLELNACVKATALSAAKEFPVYILKDLVANAMDGDDVLQDSIKALKPHCGSLTSSQLMAFG